MQPAPQGMYNPAFEHDSCGFGLIAHSGASASRWLVETSLSALQRMTHRGAVAADGLSGDGCGLLLHRPEAHLRRVAAEAGIMLPERFAAGMLFLPRDEAEAQAVRAELARQLDRAGVGLLGWRAVPVNTKVCGEMARRSLPRIEQVFVAPTGGDGDEDLNRALFMARRRFEQAAAARLAAGQMPETYVVSLSAHTMTYKGMVLPSHLADFFLDLQADDLSSDAAVFHQRFSTNTAPQWALAQPFRLLAHNGEINTIKANRGWAEARRGTWRSPLVNLDELRPMVSQTGSDSQSLDDMFEVLLAGGMDPLQALRILIPPASHSIEYLDPDLAAFYEFYALNSEPWDGPAGVVFADDRYSGCVLDRNGLRPARWQLAADGHFLIASETGVWDVPSRDIVRKGRLGPGEMIAVDMQSGRVLESPDIDRINAARAPYKSWLKAGVSYLDSHLLDPALAAEPFSPVELARFQRRFQLTREEREQVLRPLVETEAEGIGSMGDDTPLPLLSGQVRALYDSFRQAFAQVTNPPIDPLREQVVMSLATQIGREGNIFEAAPANARQVTLNSPVLSQRKLRQLLAMPEFAGANRRIDLYADAAEPLDGAIQRLCAEAESAVRGGAIILLLSDRYPQDGQLAVHALLATGAIHRHLVDAGLRCACNIVVETGTARDPHHFACLIGYGATAVYPFLAYQTLLDMGARGLLLGHDGEASELGRSYRRGIRKGLLKILSKMGISTIAGYRAAQLFEIVGLDNTVVDLCFRGTPSRVGGAGFNELAEDARLLAARAASDGDGLELGGLLRFVQGGERHAFDPGVVQALQRAVLTDDASDWETYRQRVDGREPLALRDLLRVDAGDAITLDDVETATEILPRFDSAGMSLGALSPEAHEALAIAMNRLGARSNSGEGGEDPARYGTEKRSKIKQIASGRFGVTPAYLSQAEVIQIKMAQGAKPGEGGQLPGHKVNALIARLRHARPGIGLISPPPHHDIYSIEDLAQLIFDLKQVNPDALVSVKLVSHAGIGTIAAGVVKAGADLITLSGHDGGTGASPLSSIRYAGSPWELGLAEVQQTLRRNGLRSRVRVQVDGGLKTGLDVIKAALLGADSFGFGTAPMIALGCKYLRICHLNNCATGVATQDARLRENHFKGLPERVEAYFRFIVEDLRRHLAALGVRSLDEIIGRAERLQARSDISPRQQRVDLSPLLFVDADAADARAHDGKAGPLSPEPGKLSRQLDRDLADAIVAGRGDQRSYAIANHDRSIGARLSGAIARRHGDAGMPATPLALRFSGNAGQSFGAFNATGLELSLEGDANDGVGKGMAGGRLVLRPPGDSPLLARDTPIMGNACLYGATGGELFAAGRAGERFAVRNSGAIAVVEGAGDHCCEYMTGGVVAVLGRTGLNFGAGLTGGFAYVLDIDRDFVDRYNHELVDINRISQEGMEQYLQHLRDLLGRHVEHTGSVWATEILDSFRDYLGKFWLVKPRAASLDSLVEALRSAA